ncbi:MAG: hypothetical protein QNJ29_09505 [Rhizobiaceae bacterium]|nr:hypothetical protein [Rhizobiaceae bacterium]
MSENSCPNCEYEKGKTGRPVLRGDSIHCLDCGTSWKDISAGSQLQLEDNSRERTFADMREMLRSNSRPNSKPQNVSRLKNTIDTPEFTFEEASPSFAITLASIALAMFISVGGLTAFFLLPSSNVEITRDLVSLSNIELKEQVGRAGRKVITVKGTVENSTDQHQTIRPISIILRRKDGGEIVRWRHVSHRPILKAGAKSRFASSIQYDTPLVAYAEAVFE